MAKSAREVLENLVSMYYSAGTRNSEWLAKYNKVWEDALEVLQTTQSPIGEDSRILHEMAGEVSMCWDPIPSGVFESTKAVSESSKRSDFNSSGRSSVKTRDLASLRDALIFTNKTRIKINESFELCAKCRKPDLCERRGCMDEAQNEPVEKSTD